MLVRRAFKPHLRLLLFPWARTFYHHCSVLVGSRNSFQSDLNKQNLDMTLKKKTQNIPRYIAAFYLHLSINICSISFCPYTVYSEYFRLVVRFEDLSCCSSSVILILYLCRLNLALLESTKCGIIYFSYRCCAQEFLKTDWAQFNISFILSENLLVLELRFLCTALSLNALYRCTKFNYILELGFGQVLKVQINKGQ